MKSLAGLLIVALLAGLVYKYYFANLQSAPYSFSMSLVLK